MMLVGLIGVACFPAVSAARTKGPSVTLARAAFSHLLATSPLYSQAWLHSTTPPKHVLRNPVCPEAESFDGHAQCWAEFEWRRVWFFVQGSVTVIGKAEITYAHTWRRRWRPTSGRCLSQAGLTGRLESNDGGCYAMQVQQIQMDLQAHRPVRTVFAPATDTAGFGAFTTYKCRSWNGGFQCLNQPGDGFRYQP